MVINHSRFGTLQLSDINTSPAETRTRAIRSGAYLSHHGHVVGKRSFGLKQLRPELPSLGWRTPSSSNPCHANEQQLKARSLTQTPIHKVRSKQVTISTVVLQLGTCLNDNPYVWNISYSSPQTARTQPVLSYRSHHMIPARHLWPDAKRRTLSACPSWPYNILHNKAPVRF